MPHPPPPAKNFLGCPWPELGHVCALDSITGQEDGNTLGTALWLGVSLPEAHGEDAREKAKDHPGMRTEVRDAGQAVSNPHPCGHGGIFSTLRSSWGTFNVFFGPNWLEFQTR